MPSAVARWDASEILGVDPNERTCVGYAKTQGRRCRNPIAQANRAEAAKLIRKMGERNIQSANIGRYLEELASYLLCKRWHQVQIEDKVEEWNDAIEEFREAEISRQRRSHRAHSRQARGSSPQAHSDRAHSHRAESHGVHSSTNRSATGAPVPASNTTPDLTETLESLRQEMASLNERYSTALQLANSITTSSAQTMHHTETDVVSSPPTRSTVAQESRSITPSNTTTVRTSVEVEVLNAEPAQDSTAEDNDSNVRQSPGGNTETSSSVPASDLPFSETTSPQDEGADEQTDREASVRSFSRRPIEGECSICTDSLANGSELSWCRMQCGQNFHAECVNTWLESQEEAKMGNSHENDEYLKLAVAEDFSGSQLKIYLTPEVLATAPGLSSLLITLETAPHRVLLTDSIKADKTITPHQAKTWNNPRKRPHHHDSGSLFEPINNDDSLRARDNGGESHAPKRSRALEWPLKNNEEARVSSRIRSGEQHEKRSSSSSARPSKFHEGSMNDKVSQRPPSLYTREERAMEAYLKFQEKDGDDLEMTCDAGIETSKPSGMFRFGKALASAFRPFTVWSGSRKDKDKEKTINSEKSVMQERQAKAVEAYAELKKTGFQGTKVHTHQSTEASLKTQPEETMDQPVPSFRDSGIDMDDGSPTYEPNPNDQLVGSMDALLVPPSVPKNRSVSPMSVLHSPRRSSFDLCKPSLQGLKKVASHIQMSPTKRHSDTPPVPALQTDDGPSSLAQAVPNLQRQPSKKDMARHYKLSKKVSDLENKLETARRELESSISNAPPVPDLPSNLSRKPFRPGALPTLPSERNMSPQKAELLQSMPKKQDTSSEHSQDTLPVGCNVATVDPDAHHKNNKRLEVAKDKPKIMTIQKQDDAKGHSAAGLQKRLPNLPSKTPQNSPSQHKENIPPVPPTSNVVEPVKFHPVDTRSKITDHTSVSHLNRAPSPFLGPPGSALRSKTASNSSRRGISPPPCSPALAKKPTAVAGAHGLPTEKIEPPMQMDIDVDPVKPELPQHKANKPQFLARSHQEKDRLAQNEDFEWDKDVF
ncbi:hypothetical protein ACLMJK_001995 [Lecanora helva]